MHSQIHDVVIVGSSEAAQLAAVTLARRGRSVFTCGAEGTSLPDPDSALIAAGPGEALDIARRVGGFTVHTADGGIHATRAVAFAADSAVWANGFPEASVFASSLHQCPHCDGWDHRGQKLGVLGSCGAAVDLARKLLRWSPQVTLFENGSPVELGALRQLERRRIKILSGSVSGLEGEEGSLNRLHFQDGTFEDCNALFFPSTHKFHTTLASRLGCDVERVPGALEWHPGDEMSQDGIFLLNQCGKNTATAILAWLDQEDMPAPAPAIIFQNLRSRRRNSAAARLEPIFPPVLAASVRECV